MDWQKQDLNNLQLGRYGEYYAKMKFAEHGFDIYTSEVDDKGIDFVTHIGDGNFLEIQVKTVTRRHYVPLRKKVFEPRMNLYLALLIIEPTEIVFGVIPSLEWIKTGSDRLDFLVDHDNYHPPEFGVNISAHSILVIKDKYSLSGVNKSVGNRAVGT